MADSIPPKLAPKPTLVVGRFYRHTQTAQGPALGRVLMVGFSSQGLPVIEATDARERTSAATPLGTPTHHTVRADALLPWVGDLFLLHDGDRGMGVFTTREAADAARATKQADHPKHIWVLPFRQA